MQTEVIDDAANAAFAASYRDQLPAQGTRKADIWSLCFQGGTFDRVKQRCRSPVALPVASCACHSHDCIWVDYRDRMCVHHAVHITSQLPAMHVLCTCPRCSGDFSQCKQTKYNMTLPALPATVVREQLWPDITEAEMAVASQPGMYGRVWYGQGLAFDEAYQILQDYVCTAHCIAYR